MQRRQRAAHRQRPRAEILQLAAAKRFLQAVQAVLLPLQVRGGGLGGLFQQGQQRPGRGGRHGGQRQPGQRQQGFGRQPQRALAQAEGKARAARQPDHPWVQSG